MTGPVTIAGWGPVHGKPNTYATGVRGGSQLVAECGPWLRSGYWWRVVLLGTRTPDAPLADVSRQCLRSGSRELRRDARAEAERVLVRMVEAERAQRQAPQRVA